MPKYDISRTIFLGRLAENVLLATLLIYFIHIRAKRLTSDFVYEYQAIENHSQRKKFLQKFMLVSLKTG